MRFAARFFAIVVGLILFSTFLSNPVFAQALPNSYTTPNTEADVPANLHTFTQSVFLDVISFVGCQLTGYDMGSANHQCLGFNIKTGKIGYAPNQAGLIGLMGEGIAVLYNPPQFHVSTYMQDMAGNFGIVKHTYAASNNISGYQQLQPTIKIWTAFRNTVFLLFVIVFIVIGFAIMLRAKIDPRTVMTIENQIPKIVVALILVTFSYAIAGLVIDIMWVLTYVTINLFASMDPALQHHVGNMVNNLSATPFQFLDNIAPGGILAIITSGASSIYDIVRPIVLSAADTFPFNILKWIMGLPCYFTNFGGLLNSTVGNLPGINLLTGGTNSDAAKALSQCVGEASATGEAYIAGGIAFIVFAVATLLALFKMWFTLLKSYAMFLIYALMGPFFIMMGVLPGSKINFENWLRHLLAYSFVFPFAIGTMLLAKVISDTYGSSTAQLGYIPPLIGPSQASSSAMGALLSFAVLMLLPQALTMVQDALSAPDMKYLPGVGQMLSTGTQAYTTLMNKGWERLTRHEDSVRGLSMGPVRKLVMHQFLGGVLGRLAGENPKGH